MPRTPKPKPIHHAADFGLNILSGDDDMFHWFLLTYLFGKPIQSDVAVQTWRLFIDRKLDSPWAILQAPPRSLVHILYEGKYTHYAESTASGLRICMDQLVCDYDGSLTVMYENARNEDEFGKRLRQLHGVGPKVAEIFMRETEELFARRAE